MFAGLNCRRGARLWSKDRNNWRQDGRVAFDALKAVELWHRLVAFGTQIFTREMTREVRTL
jgi:hypothetical protein